MKLLRLRSLRFSLRRAINGTRWSRCYSNTRYHCFSVCCLNLKLICVIRVQGIPSLVHPVPASSEHPITFDELNLPLFLSNFVYQTSVFLSRSSVSLGLPGLPARLLSVPAIIQVVILMMLMMYESGRGLFGADVEGASSSFIFLLITIGRFYGGLA